MIYVILCWLLFITESWLEAFVIAIKKVEDPEKPEEFEKLNKAEHVFSALFSFLIVVVTCLAMWGSWYLMLSLIPARRVFFDLPLPAFRNKVQKFKIKLPLWRYNPNPKGVDKLMANIFGHNRRWLELVVEVLFIASMILTQYFTSGKTLDWFI